MDYLLTLEKKGSSSASFVNTSLEMCSEKVHPGSTQLREAKNEIGPEMLSASSRILGIWGNLM